MTSWSMCPSSEAKVRWLYRDHRPLQKDATDCPPSIIGKRHDRLRDLRRETFGFSLTKGVRVYLPVNLAAKQNLSLLVFQTSSLVSTLFPCLCVCVLFPSYFIYKEQIKGLGLITYYSFNAFQAWGCKYSLNEACGVYIYKKCLISSQFRDILW